MLFMPPVVLLLTGLVSPEGTEELAMLEPPPIPDISISPAGSTEIHWYPPCQQGDSPCRVVHCCKTLHGFAAVL